ncbi:MAG: DUF2505 family protein [Deltaproteobacteria bacterium]|jgi:hypothetical protein|nr:DUF2505 family protein [Deltaproteobacteria bacterium]MBW2530456.1 DUF2505 family protein [Deltaproteobacteria bacterium]
MATTRTMTAVFDVSPEALVSALTDPVFLVAQQKLDEATVDARVEERRRTGQALELELHATEYSRGMLGIDRSKTEHSVTTYRWNLETKRCEWTYEGAHGDRFEAGGTDRVEPEGHGARLTTEFRLSVSVPLLGRKIEKLVLKAFAAREPKYVALLREHCAKRS